MVRCNAHKRVQALPTMPLNGVNTVDAPLQERWKSRKNYNELWCTLGLATLAFVTAIFLGILVRVALVVPITFDHELL